MNDAISGRVAIYLLLDSILFPLYGCGWLGSDIVNDTVYVFHFIDDTSGNLIQYVIGNTCPISSHEVCCCHAAQSDGIVICSEVAHNTNRTNVGDNSEILVDISVQTGFYDLFPEDGILNQNN